MLPLLPRAYPGLAVFAATALLSTGCTGLRAGPQSNAQTPVPLSRDSAWARARRALSTEAFTLDVVDSSRGRLVGTRYPSSNARQGTQAACRMTLALSIRGDTEKSELSSTSRWIAPEKMDDKAPEVCELERTQVLERIATTVAPPPAQ